MLRYYFRLSFFRLERRLIAWGVYPRLTLLLGAIVFIGLSQLLFVKTDWAAWIYGGIAAYMLQNAATKTRNERLQLIFQQTDYQRIRFIENLILITPFVLFLLLKKAWFAALLPLGFAIFFTFWQTGKQRSWTIPTPFKKYPFENIVGFRQTWWMIGGAYFLVFKAVQVGNFNLGAAALVLVFLTHLSYYFRPERELFVWIFHHTPQQFLKHKITVALRSITLMTLPILGILLCFFSTHWLPFFLIQMVGYLALSSLVLAKYSAFPREIGLPQALLYALSLSLPPLLLIAMWLFYRRAKRQIAAYLL